jgi:non-specific serine/threonine protein kinase
LEDRFALLSGGSRGSRHQTLRAVIDWSYRGLTEPEQRFFRRLAVFVGGFTLDAAEAVCADSPVDGAADLLARLVEKSLIVADAAAPVYRYRMLETLRAYGAEELTRGTDADRVRDAHATHFLGLARAAADGLRSAEQAGWLDRLETEHANLRAAMERSLATGDDETAATIAGSVFAFWDLHGHYREGRAWLDRVLGDGRRLTAATRASALMGVTTLAVIQGDVGPADVACRQAAELSRSGGDPAGVAHALQWIAYIAMIVGERKESRRLFDEAERTAVEAGAVWEHAWALILAATLALAESRFADAQDLSARAARVIGPGDPELRSWVSLIGGFASWKSGHQDAAAHIGEAIERFRGLGGVWGLSLGLLVTGLVLAGDPGRAGQAVQLLGAAEALRESAGIGLLPFVARWFDEAITALRSELGPAVFTDGWERGQATSTGDAVRAAIVELASEM